MPSHLTYRFHRLAGLLSAIMLLAAITTNAGCGARQLRETRTFDLGSDTSMTFVHIPSGVFTMGGDGHALRSFSEETPKRQVTISQDFWIAQTPTTQAQWTRFMEHDNPNVPKHPEVPIHQVSWYDAIEYANKLTGYLRDRGDIGPDEYFRLPTEAEWEYAYRAGTTGDYHFGEPRMYPFSPRVSEYEWTDANSGRRLQPVATRLPNPWGLYDMGGNVQEWCMDYFGPYPDNPETDPVGPGSGTYRVKRGGSFAHPSSHSAAPTRDWQTPSASLWFNGFRLVLTSGQPTLR